MSLSDKNQSRRQFLMTTGRYSLLAGLTFVGGVLISRSRLHSPDCINERVCQGCTAYSSCTLPSALSARRDAINHRQEANDLKG